MDLKTGLTLVILIILGVYFGNMWSHSMIQKDQDKKDEEFLRRQAEIAAAASAGA